MVIRLRVTIFLKPQEEKQPVAGLMVAGSLYQHYS